MNEEKRKRLEELRRKHRGGTTGKWRRISVNPSEIITAKSLSTGSLTMRPGGEVTYTGTLSTGSLDPDKIKVHRSGGTVATPGMVWSPPSTFTTTTGGVVPLPPATLTFPPLSSSSKPPKLLDAPVRTPKKVVVAFLDEDDNVEWCGMVYPESVDVYHRGMEPSEMQLGFKLIDANKDVDE